MANYGPGQCILLHNENELIFCEIVSYRGSGDYYVSLTRGLLLDRSSKRFLPISILNEADIQELQVDIDQL